jgi:hypothetical protein
MHSFNAKYIGEADDYLKAYGFGWFLYNSTNISGHNGDTIGGHVKIKWNQTNDIGLIYFWNSSIGNSVLGLDERLDLTEKLETELLKNNSDC